MPRRKTDSINAENTFSSPVNLKHGGVLTLSGTFTATVSLQRRWMTDTVWRDVTNNSGVATTMTLPGTYTINPAEVQADYRWGVKTGNFSAGPVVGTLERA